MAWRDKDGYLRQRHGSNKEKLAHVLVAERVLGKPLPPGAVVHHIDGDRTNNVPANLVICPSQTYHRQLHARQRALEACGHADWRRCRRCKQWDAPENLKWDKTDSVYFHPRCAAERQRAYYHRLRLAAQP